MIVSPWIKPYLKPTQPFQEHKPTNFHPPPPPSSCELDVQPLPCFSVLSVGPSVTLTTPSPAGSTRTMRTAK